LRRQGLKLRDRRFVAEGGDQLIVLLLLLLPLLLLFGVHVLRERGG